MAKQQACIAQETTVNILRQAIMEKKMRRNIFKSIYVLRSQFTVQKKLAQHRKPTMLQ